MKDFDAYEYIGVIAPGAIITIGACLQWPQTQRLLLSKDFSLGTFGIFLVCAFIVGHLIQGLGNGLERVAFLRNGLPTNWVLMDHQDILSADQCARLQQRVAQMAGKIDVPALSRREWYALTREIYARVAAVGRSGRIDAFNRNYGLMRGIATALCILSVWFFIAHWQDWRWPEASIALALLALYRMVHFAKLYARELYVQFLAL